MTVAAVHVKMDKTRSYILTAYLLAAMLVTALVVYSLWSAPSYPAPGQPPVSNCTTDAVRLTNLYPEQISVGSPQSDFEIIGCGFTAGTQVRFNGTQHAALFEDKQHIRAGLTVADVSTPGSVVVTLLNDAGKEIGSGIFHVVPGQVDWKLFWFSQRTITLEVQLFLLALFMGAFGSCVYALKSLADYRGDDTLYSTWFTYYLIQPFEGAGAAFLLYLIIRGGFLTGASAADKTVNLFGVCAIAGLAGAFSDTAFNKLREVFTALFKPDDNRSGKLKMAITTSSLTEAFVNKPYETTLQVARATPPLVWSVTPALPTGLSLEANTGVIKGTATKTTEKEVHTFTVKDSGIPPEVCEADLSLEVVGAPTTGGDTQPSLEEERELVGQS